MKVMKTISAEIKEKIITAIDDKKPFIAAYAVSENADEIEIETIICAEPRNASEMIFILTKQLQEIINNNKKIHENENKQQKIVN